MHFHRRCIPQDNFGIPIGGEALPKVRRQEGIDLSVDRWIQDEVRSLSYFDRHPNRHLRSEPVLVGDGERIGVRLVVLDVPLGQCEVVPVQSTQSRSDLTKLIKSVALVRRFVKVLTLGPPDSNAVQYRLRCLLMAKRPQLLQEFGRSASGDMEPPVLLVGVPHFRRIKIEGHRLLPLSSWVLRIPAGEFSRSIQIPTPNARIPPACRGRSSLGPFEDRTRERIQC